MLQQLLICLRGTCSVVFDDGRGEIRLDRPDVGIYIPAMIWSMQYRYSPDALLMVFPDAMLMVRTDRYDVADYIRDYDDFLAEESFPRKSNNFRSGARTRH